MFDSGLIDDNISDMDSRIYSSSIVFAQEHLFKITGSIYWNKNS